MEDEAWIFLQSDTEGDKKPGTLLYQKDLGSLQISFKFNCCRISPSVAEEALVVCIEQVVLTLL